jgi:hypothetical protein
MMLEDAINVVNVIAGCLTRDDGDDLRELALAAGPRGTPANPRRRTLRAAERSQDIEGVAGVDLGWQVVRYESNVLRKGSCLYLSLPGVGGGRDSCSS